MKPQIDYRTGKEKYVIDRDVPRKVKKGEVVICDEASMINNEMLGLIAEVVKELNVVFIFVGDSYQLPPVGEERSNALFMPNKFTLDKIVRHTNSIVDCSVKMREYIEDGYVPSIRDFDEFPDIEVLNNTNFDKMFFDKVKTGQSVLFVAWTNNRVDCQAADVRNFLGYSPTSFERGETLILNAPLIKKRSIVAGNNSIHVVDKVSSKEIGGIDFCAITTQDGLKFNTKIDYSDVKNRLDEMTRVATFDGTSKGWRAYYRFKESSVPVSFHHSVTVHKSQGSTVDEVFIDFRDIIRSDIASKLLYVAITRAAKRVYLLN